MSRLRARLLAVLTALTLAAGCGADDLDCSLGAMKASCPPGTVGFDRMAARLRIAQRLCLQKGLESGGEDYRACLAAAGPSLAPPHAARFDHLGPAEASPPP